MKARLMVIKGGVADRRLFEAELHEETDGGEVWKWWMDGTMHYVCVPALHKRVEWRGRRYLVKMDGDVVAWDFARSVFGETVIPSLIEGVVVKKAIRNLRGGVDWRKVLVYGAICVGVVIAVAFARGMLLGGPAPIAEEPDEYRYTVPYETPGGPVGP